MKTTTLQIAPAVFWVGLLSAVGPIQAKEVTGFVFEDTNRNGARDGNESGVPGVAVSNGKDVVLTDEAGRYTLDLDGDAIVFISKPSGYAVPVNEQNLPQFHYIHQPEGTPEEYEYRYRGIAPNGPLPESVDFPIYKTDEADTFTAVIFADPQPLSNADLNYLRDDVLAELVGVDAVFGLTVGDIMSDELAILPRYNRLVAQVGIPWWNLPGNHELNWKSPDDALSLETYKRTFGPPNYSFNYGKVHFIALDNVYYDGNDDSDLPFDARRATNYPSIAGPYSTHLLDVQLEWLENDLATVPDDMLVVVATHIPFDLSTPWKDERQREKFFRILSSRDKIFSLSGHNHRTDHMYFDHDHGFDNGSALHHHALTAVSGSWWSGIVDERGIPSALQNDGSPNGYYFMDIDGTAYQMRFKPASKPHDHQMRIMLDTALTQYFVQDNREYTQGQMWRDAISQDQVYSTQLVVNLFDGGPNSKVTYSVNGGDPVEMQNERFVDFMYMDLVRRYPDEWFLAQTLPTSHIWVARLPEDLESGAHAITVNAVDEYGRAHQASKILEVLD